MRHLRSFPEDTGTVVTEMYNAFAWRKDPTLQTPMVSVNGKQFYLNEFAQVRCGGLVYIRSFFLKGQGILMRVNWVIRNRECHYIDEDVLVVLPITELLRTIPFRSFNEQAGHEYQLSGGMSNFRRIECEQDKLEKLCQPHPIREKAQGQKVINCQLLSTVTIRLGIVPSGGTNMRAGILPWQDYRLKKSTKNIIFILLARPIR